MDALSFQTIYHQHQDIIWTATKTLLVKHLGKTCKKWQPLRPHPESKITRSFSKLDKTNWVGIFP